MNNTCGNCGLKMSAGLEQEGTNTGAESEPKVDKIEEKGPLESMRKSDAEKRAGSAVEELRSGPPCSIPRQCRGAIGSNILIDIYYIAKVSSFRSPRTF
jgi:hypothetical protein